MHAGRCDYNDSTGSNDSETLATTCDLRCGTTDGDATDYHVSFRVSTCSASVGEVQGVVAGGAAQGVFPGTADVPPWYVCPSFREVVQGKTQSV